MEMKNQGRLVVYILWTTLVVFLTLKFSGVITWSWLWVLAPAWGPVVVIGLVFILVSQMTH